MTARATRKRPRKTRRPTSPDAAQRGPDRAPPAYRTASATLRAPVRGKLAARRAPLRDAPETPRYTPSWLEVKPVYTRDDLPRDLERRAPPPGTPPFTRGIHPEMHRARLWTMRQYAGFGSA